MYPLGESKDAEMAVTWNRGRRAYPQPLEERVDTASLLPLTWHAIGPERTLRGQLRSAPRVADIGGNVGGGV